MKKESLNFQSCNKEYNDSKIIIVGYPMDVTTSFRPGTRFAPDSIRVASKGIEWYSPYQEKDLNEYQVADIGDINLPVGIIDNSLEIIHQTTKMIIWDHKIPISIGGEHLITLPILRAMHEKYPNLRVIHFDAHTDLREKFLGSVYSHATFMRHAHKFLGDHKIYQFGIRSGEKVEFEWAKTHIHQIKFNLSGIEKVVEDIKKYPVYITIDVDVLDPSIMPGTGTPEAGGITFNEIMGAIDEFQKLTNIVGIDLVELSPSLDSSGNSSVTAAKLLRELILLVCK